MLILATLIIIAAIAVSVMVSVSLTWHFFDRQIRPILLRDIKTVTKGSDLKCKVCFDYVMSWSSFDKRPTHIIQSETGKYEVLKHCKTAVIIIDGQALCSGHVPPQYDNRIETYAQKYCMDVWPSSVLKRIECHRPKNHAGDHDAVEVDVKWENRKKGVTE